MNTRTAQHRQGAAEAARRLRAGELSSADLIEACLSRIDSVNPAVNALTTVHAERARYEASEADRRIAAGALAGPLHAVPVTVKDNIDVGGEATTQGVYALRGAVATEVAPCVALLRRAGAIVLARSNMPDLALRWHTDSDIAGPTRNPWDASSTPGGSSGGEAVALTTGMSVRGVGTDLGGSLRWPSQCAGTAALRPSLGRIPQARGGEPDPIGLQLLDVTGPMARRIEDLRLALSVMSAPDSRDPWHVPVGTDSGPALTRRVHVLVPDGDVDPAVRVALQRAATALGDLGYEFEEQAPPGLDEVVDIWAGIMGGDARLLWPGVDALVSEGARRFMDAMFTLAPDRGREAHAELFRTRHRLAPSWGEYARTCPLVLAPIFSAPPFGPGEDLDGVDAAAEIVTALRATLVANLLGLPAVAVPTLVDGRPTAVQLTAPRFAELGCLDAAAIIETAFEAQTGRITPIDPR